MDPAVPAIEVIRASAMLLVLALGLRATPASYAWAFRRPALLLRSLVAMNVVMPAIAAAGLAFTRVPQPVQVALLTLAISPVPPFLPGRQLAAGSQREYIFALFLVSAMATLVVVFPALVFVAVCGGGRVSAEAWRIAYVVASTMLVPIAIGTYVARLLPHKSVSLAVYAERIGTLLLWIALVFVVIEKWAAMKSLAHDGSLLAALGFAAVGLLVGHTFGRPDARVRSALAVATACRHPGVALALSGTLFPGQELIPAATLLALLAGVLVSTPYIAWRAHLYAAQKIDKVYER